MLHGTRRITLVAVAALVSVMALFVASFGGAFTASAAAVAALAPSSIQGHVATDGNCPQPPVGVDLSALSAAQLAYYGLLQRPKDASRLAKWRDVLRHSLHRYCAVTPAPAGLHGTSRENSSIWAGNVAINYGYDDVSSDWYVPCVSGSPFSSYSLTWVGIGGDGNDGGGNLVQAGTEQDIDSNGGRHFYAWYEDYPHDPVVQRLSNYAIGCSDYMYVEVYQGSSSETYYIDDYTTNDYTSPSESGYTSNGSTAEWIEERPPGTTLANFAYVTFSGAFTLRYGSVLRVGDTTHNYDVMVVGSKQLAHPGPINPADTFTVYHDAS
jgi:Peptidase A4 family